MGVGKLFAVQVMFGDHLVNLWDASLVVSSFLACTLELSRPHTHAGIFELLQGARQKELTVSVHTQIKTFNALMNGKDMVVKSRTGSGKTIAFALPVVEQLLKVFTSSLLMSPQSRDFAWSIFFFFLPSWKHKIALGVHLSEPCFKSPLRHLVRGHAHVSRWYCLLGMNFFTLHLRI
jgi:hypothetical protein